MEEMRLYEGTETTRTEQREDAGAVMSAATTAEKTTPDSGLHGKD